MNKTNHALLSPVQVCGATVRAVASFTSPGESYDWQSQKCAGPLDPVKEGTATGSNANTHLEDWND